MAVGALASTVAAPSALAGGHGAVEDMTHELHHEFPTYFGVPGYEAESLYNYADHKFNLLKLSVNEHTGTHIDAPLHFSADGHAVNEIPVDRLVVPLCVIDIAAKADADADAQVTPDDIKAYIAAHGPIPPTNRYGIENLANLDRVPAAGATLVVGAPKHRGGTGGPARIFALV